MPQSVGRRLASCLAGCALVAGSPRRLAPDARAHPLEARRAGNFGTAVLAAPTA